MPGQYNEMLNFSEAYDYQRAKVEFCSSQAGWHPDCNDDKIYKRYYEKTVKEGASK
jgi:hypothetical protein